ncbi:MAG: hypothetical protein JO113_02025 [Candidatus Eremiobacteraeota bacterium]|nr:hypothetical protein [Candidatus Eremiobacteraeota bacterium]
MTKFITVKVNDVRDLFREHEFDPFNDDADRIDSIAQMAQFPNIVSQLQTLELRVLVPAAAITQETEAQVRHALSRYSAHMVMQVRRKLAAMRWVGLRTSLIGLVFFGMSLAAAAAVGRALFIPEGLRTLASESLIVAGWVLLWQPLDTLVQGWWPQWEEERTFRAIAALPLRLEAF